MKRAGCVAALVLVWLGVGACSGGDAGGPPDNGLSADACAAMGSCAGGGACGSAAESPAMGMDTSGFSLPRATIRLDPSSEGVGQDAGIFHLRQAGGKTAKPKKTAKTWKAAGAKPNASRLQVGDKDFLPLEGAEVTAEVVGFRARVVLDLLYKNDRDQQLHGSFQLRLPDGATPYYLAFGATKWEKPTLIPTVSTSIADIREERATSWEALKEARVVPRAKAAHAYGEVVRQKVDPALLEWAGAGVFRTKVFPLEPGALHRITIGYELSLTSVGDDAFFALDLPELERGDLEVDISARGIKAEVEPKTEQREGRWHWRNPDVRRIVLRGEAAKPITIKGVDPSTGAYFATRFAPTIPDAPGESASRAVFLLDTSLSSNPDAYRIWLRLLREVLDRNRGTLSEFAVAAFNIETHWWKPEFAANTPANVTQLMAWAESLALEGATDVSRALRAAGQRPEAYDLFLLSDGSPTWGEDDLDAMAAAIPDARRLYSYVTGLGGTDQRVLRHLARETGGSVFTVTGPSQIPAAAMAHTKRPWRIQGVRVPGCTDVLIAGRPSTIYPGQRLTLAGRGTPTGPAVIEITRDQQARTDQIPLGDAVTTPMAPALYGRIAVGRLEELGTWTNDEARAYATHFRVVGKTCSLLMLESEADYEQYGIKPRDDAVLVQHKQVLPVVESAEQKAEGTRASPRARVVALLSRLEDAPSTTFDRSATMNLLLEQMPEAAFDVPEEALACASRTWRDIPGRLQEHLAARDLDYEETSKEAERRRKKFGVSDSLRAWSSLVEQNPGDMALVRDVGYVARELGLRGQAHRLFWRVAEKRPYQPQTWMAMAQCLAEMGRTELAAVFFEAVLSTKWSPQYGEMDLVASFEYLRFLRGLDTRVEGGSLLAARRDDLAGRLKVKAADLVVLIAWNTDRTDVDLHVKDPTGEECYYSHPTTKMGGRLTKDVTQGFGPEMFVLKSADPGSYQIKAKYYSGDTTRTATRTRVHATVIENWGRPNERATQRVFLLERSQQMHKLATIRWDGGAGRLAMKR